MPISSLKKRLGASALLLAGSFALSQGALAQEQAEFDGQWIYETRCADCHGDDGEGFYPFGMPIRGNTFVQQSPAAAIIAVIQAGVLDDNKSRPEYSGMPPFDYIRAGEARALVAYMKEELQD